MTEAVAIDNEPRAPGWYVFEQAPGGGSGGQLIAGERPCEVRWQLDPARRRQVLLLHRPARGARLVPGIDGVERGRLRAVGRVRALMLMITDRSGVMEALACSWEFTIDSVVMGLRTATARLYARYRGRFAPPALQVDAWRLRDRLFRLRPTRLQLRPAHHLESAGTGKWVATGSDPYFFLERPDGSVPVLRGGWYKLDGRLEVEGGLRHVGSEFHYRIVGRPEPLPRRVALADPWRDGRISILVRFDGDVNELRFDPSMRPVEFRMRGIGLRRLSRIEWMLRLLSGLRDASGRRDWRLARSALAGMWAARRTGGIAAAGSLLADVHDRASRLHSRSYDAWVHRYDTFSRRDLAAIARAGKELAEDGPLVSILLPTYETPEAWLRRCIESVRAQGYPKWELCVADDASNQPHVARVLHEYARLDPRIRVEFRECNGHIAAASNTALAMAQGEFVALLDHDDELRPHALLETVAELRANPGAKLVYSDEDKIDERGRRFQPYFKPDWNPDLLLSQNYVCHFTTIETRLAREVGGFREGMEGSQDHDLFLRCTAGLPANAIRHVPKVLYHWRAIAGSTALERGAKDYAAEAGLRAVASALHARSPEAGVEPLAHGHYRVRWPLPSPQPSIAIIVPTRDRVELLRQCVESVLAKTRYENFELVVVDNGSRDAGALAYLESLRGRARVRVLRDDAPFNFSALNNRAVAHCGTDLLCLLNNDVEVIDGDWLREMASQAWRPEIGAVGALLLYPDDSIQHAGVFLGLGGVANHAYAHQPWGVPGHGARALVAQELSAVTGACLVVRRKAYLEVGGLDEELQVAFNDIDFCLRLREAGYRNLWTPFARLYHHESASRGAEDTPAKIARFKSEVALMRDRWAPLLDDDPAYNPNLSLDAEATASELAFPPRERKRRCVVDHG